MKEHIQFSIFRINTTHKIDVARKTNLSDCIIFHRTVLHHFFFLNLSLNIVMNLMSFIVVLKLSK